MDILSILAHYQSSFLSAYGHRLTREQRHALQSMLDCRSARFGEMHLQCNACQHRQSAFHSCGHRSCPRCQHHDTSRWLERQQQKLLPVSYFMVTFTLPYELRAVTVLHQKKLYSLLFDCAVSTLKDFAHNDPALGGDIGLTAVLHTHTRRLDYHPHIHVIVPAGCVKKLRKQWCKLSGDYLFNNFNLARVFRARFLSGITGLDLGIPVKIPEQWRVNCRPVGKGLPAIRYLSRYLYRGVISEKNIVADDGHSVTFRYQDSDSKETRTRTLPGEEFIWLLLQHVLPTGFRRIRDYGFLHGNAKKTLRLIQLVLGVITERQGAVKRPAFRCAVCKGIMSIIAFVPPVWRSG